MSRVRPKWLQFVGVATVLLAVGTGGIVVKLLSHHESGGAVRHFSIRSFVLGILAGIGVVLVVHVFLWAYHRALIFAHVRSKRKNRGTG